MITHSQRQQCSVFFGNALKWVIPAVDGLTFLGVMVILLIGFIFITSSPVQGADTQPFHNSSSTKFSGDHRNSRTKLINRPKNDDERSRGLFRDNKDHKENEIEDMVDRFPVVSDDEIVVTEGEADTGSDIDATVDVNIPAEAKLSVWGAYRPGSWCRYRTTGVTSDGQNSLRSVTETKLTLLKISHDGVTLRREVTIFMGAVNHVKPPEIVKYDFFGMPIIDGTAATNLTPSSLSISRKVIPCQVRQVEQNCGVQLESTTIWYSSVVTPYLLQKETKMFDPATDTNGNHRLIGFSKMTLSKTSANVLLGNSLVTYRSQTVLQKGNTVTTTKTVHSTRIPGGILKETTTENDAAGKTLYVSNRVLLDFFAARR